MVIPKREREETDDICSEPNAVFVKRRREDLHPMPRAMKEQYTLRLDIDKTPEQQPEILQQIREELSKLEAFQDGVGEQLPSTGRKGVRFVSEDRLDRAIEMIAKYHEHRRHAARKGKGQGSASDANAMTDSEAEDDEDDESYRPSDSSSAESAGE